jgi:nicotinic acid mononucleotide adenylyltransferase
VETLPSRLPQLAARMVAPTARPSGSRMSIFLIDAVTADVSSTAIRQRRAVGLLIEGLVDPLVARHIEQHGLYASDTPDRRGNV